MSSMRHLLPPTNKPMAWQDVPIRLGPKSSLPMLSSMCKFSAKQEVSLTHAQAPAS